MKRFIMLLKVSTNPDAIERSYHKIMEKEDIDQGQELVHKIYIDDKIIEYILNIVFATRFPTKYNQEELENLSSV